MSWVGDSADHGSSAFLCHSGSAGNPRTAWDPSLQIQPLLLWGTWLGQEGRSEGDSRTSDYIPVGHQKGRPP